MCFLPRICHRVFLGTFEMATRMLVISVMLFITVVLVSKCKFYRNGSSDHQVMRPSNLNKVCYTGLIPLKMIIRILT